MAVIKTIQESSLTALGDAIRAKTGKNDLLQFPTGMVEAINNIQTGGGGGEIEPIKLTGSCDYACAGAIASKYVALYGDTITTDRITSLSYMFYYYENPTVPFDINYSGGSQANASNMFYSAKIVAVPKVSKLYPNDLTRLVSYCTKLKSIPENWTDDWNWSRVQTYGYANAGSIFQGCNSLRNVPTNMIKQFTGIHTYSSYTFYNNTFNQCYVLDEIVGLGVNTAAVTSNLFSYTFDSCHRLKRFTFDVNDDGTPKTANWKSQTINLSVSSGYSNNATYATSWGIDASKEVKDDATYQALKNDPDWFTCNKAYARYNHDSAVETINSLPDCSASGGTNTIKFQGAAGEKTDGGAINTLTEEEIAVAAAKGWTVSLV